MNSCERWFYFFPGPAGVCARVHRFRIVVTHREKVRKKDLKVDPLCFFFFFPSFLFFSFHFLEYSIITGGRNTISRISNFVFEGMKIPCIATPDQEAEAARGTKYRREQCDQRITRKDTYVYIFYIGGDKCEKEKLPYFSKVLSRFRISISRDNRNSLFH